MLKERRDEFGRLGLAIDESRTMIKKLEAGKEKYPLYQALFPDAGLQNHATQLAKTYVAEWLKKMDVGIPVALSNLNEETILSLVTLKILSESVHYPFPQLSDYLNHRPISRRNSLYYYI